MLFSICVPAYNAQKYLRTSVDSILSQSFQDYEIVIIEDGSTDGSAELCDQLANEYPQKIRVIHNHENKGLLLSRRIFFQHAKGDWFLAVDADDRLADGALERIRSAIEHYHCDLILYDLVCIRLNSEVERFTVPLNENYLYTGAEKKRVYEQTAQNNYINSMCTKAIKRTIVDMDTDYTLWRELQVGEDLFQTYPILDRAESILYMKTPLYQYMKRKDSLTNRSIQNWYEQKCILWDREDEYIQKWSMGDEYSTTIIRGRLRSFIVYIDQLFADDSSKDDRIIILDAIRRDGRIKKWFSLAEIKHGMKLRHRIYCSCFTHGWVSLLGYCVGLTQAYNHIRARFFKAAIY